MESKSNNVTESTTIVGKIYQVGPTLSIKKIFVVLFYEIWIYFPYLIY